MPAEPARGATKKGRRAPLSLLVVLVAVAFVVLLHFAVESQDVSDGETYGGSCGSNLTWSYDSSTMVLTISGYGDMNDYGPFGAPWSKYITDGSTIEFVNTQEPGITSIGKNAFITCKGLSGTLTIPDSVTSIGDSAFGECRGLKYVTFPDSDIATNLSSSFFWFVFYENDKRIDRPSWDDVKGKTWIGIGNGKLCWYAPDKATFDLAGGSVASVPEGWEFSDGKYTKDFDYGTPASDIIADFGDYSREGYTRGSETVSSDTMGMGGMTIAATWTINSYVVTIAVNDGEYGSVDLTSVIVHHGTEVTVSGNVLTIGTTAVTALPAATNAQYAYFFNSWTGAPQTVAGDIAVTANFTALVRAYTVAFDVQGHGTAPEDQIIGYGGKVTIPANITAAGFVFGGWFKDPACTEEWDFVRDAVVGNTTLFAKWAEGYEGGIHWVIDVDTLTLSKKDGTDGKMNGYSTESRPLWETVTGWRDVTIVVINDGVTAIGESAFSGCTGITDLYMGDSVTSIGASAFSGCTGITDLYMGDSVTSIGGSAFEGCSGLKFIYFQNSSCSTDLSSSFAGTEFYLRGEQVTEWDDVKGKTWIGNGDGKLKHDNYIVTFSPNIGSCPIKSITSGDRCTLPPLPVATCSGWIFSGWYTNDGTQITSDTIITQDITVYAYWQRVYS